MATTETGVNVGFQGDFSEIDFLRNQYHEPFDLASFMKVARNLAFVEQVDCWIAMDKYRDLPQLQLQETAYKIISEFVGDDARNQANISSSLAKQTVDSAAAMDYSSDQARLLFKEAQAEILGSMLLGVIQDHYIRTLASVAIDLSRKEALWWRDKHMTVKKFFSFPNPVYNPESRSHAVLVSMLFLAAFIINYFLPEDQPYIWYYICYGYIARCCSGPKWDIQAYFVLFVVSPIVKRFGRGYYAGPPRRFAQLLGGCMAIAGVLCYLLLPASLYWVSYLLFAVNMVVSGIFGFCGFCTGCFIFGLLMKCGLIPEETCALCRLQYNVAARKADNA